VALGAVAVAGLGVIYAPPALVLPPPIYVEPPPIILGLPEIAPFPLAEAAPVPPVDGATWIAASAAPPVAVLPPPSLIAEAGPPPVILSPPDCALVMAPPVLMEATIAPAWRSGGYITGYALAVSAVAVAAVPRRVVRYERPPVVILGAPPIWVPGRPGWGPGWGPRWHPVGHAFGRPGWGYHGGWHGR
jgi:hypothetical protein